MTAPAKQLNIQRNSGQGMQQFLFFMYLSLGELPAQVCGSMFGGFVPHLWIDGCLLYAVHVLQAQGHFVNLD